MKHRVEGPQQKQEIRSEESPSRTACGLGVATIAGAAIAAVTLWFLWVYRHYPYYFLWDMDLFGPIGSMTIHREEIPRVLGHPAFGMYLLQALSHRVAYSCGLVSVLGSDQLGGSLSPTLGVAELTSYLRLHSPLMVTACVLALWGAAVRVLKPSIWLSLVILATLAAVESFALNATMIRAELFAIFYWSAAILLVAFAARSTRPWLQAAGITAAGAMLGLCFLTKVQALIYICAVPVIFLLMLFLCPDTWRNLGKPVAKCFAFSVSLATGVAEVVLCVLLLVVGKVEIPSDFRVWADGFSLQHYTALLIGGVAVLVVAQLCMAMRREIPACPFRISSFATYLFAGFLASFLFHFLLYDDVATGYRYLVYDVKIAFLRDPVDGFFTYVKGIAALDALRHYNPALFYMHVFTVAALAAGAIFNWLDVPKRIVLPLVLLLGVTIANQALAVRVAVPRDLIWVELLPIFLSVLYLTILYRRAMSGRVLIRCLAFAGLVVMLGNSYVHSSSMFDRIDWRFNRYGWRDGWWFSDLGGYNEYPKLILPEKDRHLVNDVRFRDRANLGQLARQHREVRRTANFVVQNQTVTFRNIGLLAPGYPVWTSDLAWRVKALSPRLNKALVVDVKDLPIDRPRTIKSLAHGFRELAWPQNKDTLCLLGRPDLDVYLFLHPDDARHLVESKALHADALETCPTVLVSNNKEMRELRGVQVSPGADIPLQTIQHPFFVAIARNPLSALTE